MDLKSNSEKDRGPFTEIGSSDASLKCICIGNPERVLCEQFCELNNEMFKTIEKIAPVTTKTITSRHKKPRYDEDLKNQRKIMKNRGRKWLKYREDQHRKAYKRD